MSVALAGCVGGGSDEDASDEKTRTSESVDPGGNLGGIDGTVTDEELRPLVGAEVGLREGGEPQVTDDFGYFFFGDLQPGTYTVDVAKLGFLPGARSVEVRAGSTSRADVQLAALGPILPVYPETTQFVGYYQCALGAAAWVSSCTYPYTAVYLTLLGQGVNASQYGAPEDLQKNPFRYNFTVKPGAVEVVSEMIWVPSSPAATNMQLILSCANYDPVLDDCLDANSYASVEGQSPLRVEWAVAGKVKNPPEWVMARGYLPFFDPQVALEQRFEIWNTVWYNGEAPDEFSILDET